MSGWRDPPSKKSLRSTFCTILQGAYEQRHGRAPVELCHWDPSEGFSREFAHKLVVPGLGEPFHYRYSFESDVRSDVLRKLGYSASSRRILLTENGTNAVLAVANALALVGIRRVALLSPCYFATSYALERFGIAVRRIYWPRSAGSFAKPDLTLHDEEALWAESPIFGTGMSADDLLGPTLRELAIAGRVVVYDRSLEPDAGPLVAYVEECPRYLTIHAPHKTVCINGLKFGAATFPADFYDAFDHWADVLAGGLSLSAEAATRHYVTPAFDNYARAIEEHVSSILRPLSDLICTFSPALVMDNGDVGYWRTLYAPKVAAALGNDKKWLAGLIEETGAVPIPGIWTGCSPDWGFCFRLNLLRYDSSFRGALHRVMRVLSQFPSMPQTP